MLLYMMYILCIVTLYKINKNRIYLQFKSLSILKNYFLFWVCIVVYSLVTSLLITGDIFLFFKFTVAIVISLLCVGLESVKIIKLFKWFYILNIIYGAILLTNPVRAYSYMASGAINYLNMTLTLGLCLSLSLVGIVYYIFYKKYKYTFISFFFTVFFFLVVMLFAARGVILFPPLIAMIMAYSLSKNKKGKFLLFILILGIIGYFAFQFFITTTSGFTLDHMTRLFENPDEEDRIGIWEKAINLSLDNLWVFFGAGFNGSQYYLGGYPHNVLLHFLSDFGILGFIGFGYIILYVIRSSFKMLKKRTVTLVEEVNILSFVGFLYYFLTFSKSFSLYDSCPLLIMISLCITSSNIKTHKTIIHVAEK